MVHHFLSDKSPPHANYSGIALPALILLILLSGCAHASLTSTLQVGLGHIPNATFPLDDSLKHSFLVNNTGSQNLSIAVTAFNSKGQMVPVYPQPGIFIIQAHQGRHVSIVVDSGSGQFPEIAGQIGALTPGNYTVPVRWVLTNTSDTADNISFTVNYHVRVISQQLSYNEMHISGKVVDASGKPVPNINVELLARMSAQPHEKFVQPNGTFSFSVPNYSNYVLAVPGSCFSGSCYAPEYVPVNSSTSYYTITLTRVNYLPAANFSVARRVNTTVGFWRGDTSSDGRLVLMSQGMEIWGNKTALKNTSKLFLFTINGAQLWNYSMGWEAWGASLSHDGRYATYVTLQNTSPSFGLINATTGHSIWVEQLSNSTFPLPAGQPMQTYQCREARISRTDKYIGLGCSNGVFYLVSLGSGAVLWHRYVVGQVRAVQFSADDQYVYVGSDPFLYKYSTSDGKMVWGSPADIWAWPLGLSLPDSGGMIASTSKTGDITVVNTTNGNVLWRANTGGIGQWVAFTPDGSKVAGASFGGTEAFNSYTGQLLWRAVGSKFASFSADGKYLMATGGSLYTSDGFSAQNLLPSPSAAQSGQAMGEQLQLYMFAYMNPNDTRAVATFAGPGGYQDTGILFFAGNITESSLGGSSGLGGAQSNQTGQYPPPTNGNQTNTIPPGQRNQSTNTMPPTIYPGQRNQSVNGTPPPVLPGQRNQSPGQVQQPGQPSNGGFLSALINAIIKFLESL